jgi:flagellar capping protein FliD
MSGMEDIDINSLVNSAMQYQYIPLTRYQTELAVENKQISVYGALKGLFSDLQNKLQALSHSFSTPAFTLSSSDPAVANIKLIGNALNPGTHEIVVSQMATAQSYLSNNVYASKVDALGLDETITLTNTLDNSKTVSIKIDPADTLANIQKKINAASTNLGITANIISSSDGMGNLQYQMIIGAKTGLINQFDISSDAGTSGFANFNQTSTANDAHFTFDGLNQVRSSNVVDDVIDQLEIDLNKVGSTTIEIDNNNAERESNVKKSLNDALASYNTLIEYLDANTVIKIKTNTQDDKGKVNDYFQSTRNDAFVNLKAGLINTMNSVISGLGGISSISELGLKGSAAKKLPDPYDDKNMVPSSGNLEVDNGFTLEAWNKKTLFNFNIEDNFASVESFLNDPKTGLIKKMNVFIDDNVNDSMNSSLYFNGIQQINQHKTLTEKRIDAENDRLVVMKNFYYKLYSNLTSIMDKYDNISKSLDGMVLNLNNLNKTK